MKVINVKIDKGTDKAVAARQIGDAIAGAIADGITGADNTRSTAGAPTKTGNLNSEALQKFTATDEEYKAFKSEAYAHINALVDLFKENKDKYGCSIVIGCALATGKDSNAGGKAVCGVRRSVADALDHLAQSEIRDIFEAVAVLRSSIL